MVCGLICGRLLPSWVANRLGIGLFWVGIPIGIVVFLRKTNLSGAIWIAPAIAYMAIFLGLVMAGLVITIYQKCTQNSLSPPAIGSLLLAAMVGNTGYLGYPVTLSLSGSEYFAWALFYDLIGTTIGAYGFGVALAAKFSGNQDRKFNPLQAMFCNPALASLLVGILLRPVSFPNWLNLILDGIAWSAIALSLILIGMRLSQIRSSPTTFLPSYSLLIKMFVVPLLLSQVLPYTGLEKQIIRVLVLQSAMPPAFATLLLAENFNLDRDITVTTLAFGTILLLATIPLWLWLT